MAGSRAVARIAALAVALALLTFAVPSRGATHARVGTDPKFRHVLANKGADGRHAAFEHFADTSDGERREITPSDGLRLVSARTRGTEGNGAGDQTTVTCLDVGASGPVARTVHPAPDGPCAPPAFSAVAPAGAQADPLPPVCLPLPGIDDRCESWVATYDNPDAHGTSTASGLDRVFASATDPAGERLFVTGISAGGPSEYDAVTGPSEYDAVTIGYDIETGNELWAAHYDGPGGDAATLDSGLSIAVSLDGRTVFVAGVQDADVTSFGTGAMVTIAYDAGTGERRWAVAYDPSEAADAAFGVAVSPDGSRVFVAGSIARSANPTVGNVGALALDAQTGATLWTAAYDGGFGDQGIAVAVTPDGERVIVLGQSWHNFSFNQNSFTLDYTTVALASGLDEDPNVQGGDQLWADRYTGAKGENSLDQPFGMALSPDGTTVFVTGGSQRTDAVALVLGAVTVAYDTLDGTVRWVARLDPPRNTDFAVGLAIGAGVDGEQVFVTGAKIDRVADRVADPNFVTIAYDASSGQSRWVATYAGPGQAWELAYSLAVGPTGDRVYVTGASGDERLIRSDYATVAYDTDTGNQAWAGRHNFSPAGVDLGFDPEVSIAAGPAAVVVAGTFFHRAPTVSAGGLNGQDFQVWSYADGPSPSPSPSPTETVSPTPTPTPSPSAAPQPETSEVSFTDDSRTSGQFSDETIFEARLTDSDGDQVAGAELNFELTGSESSRSFTATTDGDGVASVTPTLEEKPGPYQLTVRYAGDDAHEPSSNTTTFVVDKEDTDLELTVEGNGNKRTLTARLSDQDSSSDGIAGRSVDFFADGELIGSATTDADGVATLKPPPRYRGGKHDFEARFAGDDFYSASSDEPPGQGGGKDDDAGGKGFGSPRGRVSEDSISVTGNRGGIA